MGVFHFFTGVELQGGREGTGLHAVEYLLGVEEAALAGVEVKAGAVKFFLEQGDVVAVGVVAAQVGVADEVVELLSYVGEGGAVLEVEVGQPVDGGGLGRDGYGGVDLHFQFLGGAAVGEELDETHLHDAILDDIEAGGFEVKKH